MNLRTTHNYSLDSEWQSGHYSPSTVDDIFLQEWGVEDQLLNPDLDRARIVKILAEYC